MAVDTEELHIAYRLKEFRISLKIKQKQIAEGSGTKQSHVSAMENGVKQVQPRVILYLAENYNLNVDWLFTGRGERQLIKGVAEPSPPYRRISKPDLEARVEALETELKKIKLKHN